MKVYKYIYKITNLLTNKFYIGRSTKNISDKLDMHNGKRGNIELYNDMLKYGKDNFKLEILDIAVSKQELTNKERYWIIKTEAITKGYNKILPKHVYDTREYYFGLTTVYRFKPISS